MDNVKVLLIVHVKNAVGKDADVEGPSQIVPNDPGLRQCVNVVRRVAQDGVVGHRTGGYMNGQERSRDQPTGYHAFQNRALTVDGIVGIEDDSRGVGRVPSSGTGISRVGS